jgi:hypothetical protein
LAVQFPQGTATTVAGDGMATRFQMKTSGQVFADKSVHSVSRNMPKTAMQKISRDSVNFCVDRGQQVSGRMKRGSGMHDCTIAPDYPEPAGNLISSTDKQTIFKNKTNISSIGWYKTNGIFSGV